MKVMGIKKIKADGVAKIDAFRAKVSFSDDDRHKMEQIYQKIRSQKHTAVK
jgi:hypothetical protein